METALASSEVKFDVVLQSEVRETEQQRDLETILSLATDLNPILGENTGLLLNSPIKTSDEEDRQLIVTSNEGQNVTNLPEIKTEIEHDLEGLRDPLTDVSVNSELQGKENVSCDKQGDSQAKKSPKDLKIDIACFKKYIQHEVERSIGTVLRARLPLLMERIAKRDMQQTKAKAEQAAKSGQNERSSARTGMKNCLRKERAARLKTIGLAAIFASSAVMNRKEKQWNNKLKSMKDKNVQKHSSPEVGKNAKNIKNRENTERDVKDIEEKTSKGKDLVIHFDKETAQAILENERKHFELAKKRFQLQQRKSQQLAMLREKKEWNSKPSLTSSFCFSYFTPLHVQSATPDDEAESSYSDIEEENDL